MSFFSSKARQVAPVLQLDSGAAEKARLDAERSAIAERNMAGRRSTIAAGGDIAAEDQLGRGLLSQKKRAASTTLGAEA
jgi:hypothetical protein